MEFNMFYLIISVDDEVYDIWLVPLSFCSAWCLLFLSVVVQVYLLKFSFIKNEA